MEIEALVKSLLKYIASMINKKKPRSQEDKKIRSQEDKKTRRQEERWQIMNVNTAGVIEVAWGVEREN